MAQFMHSLCPAARQRCASYGCTYQPLDTNTRQREDSLVESIRTIRTRGRDGAAALPFIRSFTGRIPPAPRSRPSVDILKAPGQPAAMPPCGSPETRPSPRTNGRTPRSPCRQPGSSLDRYTAYRSRRLRPKTSLELLVLSFEFQVPSWRAVHLELGTVRERVEAT